MKSMKEANEEEARLTIKNCEDGIPFITVVVDGSFG